MNIHIGIAQQRASVLVGLLWCLVLLSLVVIGVLHTARMDLQLGKNYGDRIQAHYLALAGVEKAKALLYRDARDRSRSGQNHGKGFYDAPDEFREVSLGRGKFDVFRRGCDDESGGVLYGVSDEESRVNLNIASTDALSKLNGMTADVLAAITDWRDGDNAASPGGAESDYYLSLKPPYLPRNGPFETIRELLMVRGVTSPLLFGKDTHCNDLLDSDEENGKPTFYETQTADADLGWARILTVNSGVKNVNASGEDRVNVRTADESALQKIRGITPDIARSIVSYRGQNQIQNIANLLDVTNSQTNRGGANASPTPNQNNSSGSGRTVISPELLMDIGDDVSVGNGGNLQSGLININTASIEVLQTLPGIDRQLAHAIISYRQSSGFFPNIACLLKVQGFSADLLKQVAPFVTARSETFRILSEGRVNSSGVRQRIQAVVHIGLSDITTASYREDDL